MRDRYGDTYKIIAGSFVQIVSANPQLAKEILVNNYKKLGKPSNVRKLVIEQGVMDPSLFIVDPGDEWKRLRAISSTAFSENSLKRSFENGIHMVINDLVDLWKKKISKGIKEIDDNRDMGLLTLDTIGKAGFGFSLNAIKNEDTSISEMIEKNFSTFMYREIFPSFLFLYFPFGIFKTFRENFHKFMELLTKFINAKKDDLEEIYLLL